VALVLDTGVIYASLDRADRDHVRSLRLIADTAQTREPLVIPAPVLVELDQLTSARGHPDGFLSVLDDIGAARYLYLELDPWDLARAREVCERYADSNVGFVDAAVLAVVERLGELKLATLDRRHFSLLRPRHVEALTLLPG
jgi:uncharacterized protein